MRRFLICVALVSLGWSVNGATLPECSADDKYIPDDKSCTKFYECVDQKLVLNECPQALFFDQSQLICLPAISAECDFTAEKAKLLLDGKAPKIYMGFDDGPAHGTRDVLGALEKNNVKATFFINAVSMAPGLGRDYAAFNRETLKNIVEDGHDLGDHSFNHLKHNNKDANGHNAFKNLKKDLGAFGFQHSAFVKAELISAGIDEKRATKVTQQMNGIVRLPFTNAWRVRLSDGRDSIVGDCQKCTTPLSSGKISVQLADALHDGRNQANIFGWDVEWQLDYLRSQETGITEEKAAQTLLAYVIDSINSSKEEGKIVVLAHDREFGAPTKGESDLDLAVALDLFIKSAKKAGFTFRKLADYPADY